MFNCITCLWAAEWKTLASGPFRNYTQQVSTSLPHWSETKIILSNDNKFCHINVNSRFDSSQCENKWPDLQREVHHIASNDCIRKQHIFLKLCMCSEANAVEMGEICLLYKSIVLQTIALFDWKVQATMESEELFSNCVFDRGQMEQRKKINSSSMFSSRVNIKWLIYKKKTSPWPVYGRCV